MITSRLQFCTLYSVKYYLISYEYSVPPSEALFLTLATVGGEGPSVTLLPYKYSVVAS